MLRTSRYTIFVEFPDHRNDVPLVHGHTGTYGKATRGTAGHRFAARRER